jgi:hypothetical protein
MLAMLNEYALFFNKRRLFFACALVLILITHLTNDRISNFLSSQSQDAGKALKWSYFVSIIVPNLKGLFFFVAVAALFYPIARDICRILKSDWQKYIGFTGISLIISSLLLALGPQLGLRSMGESYGRMAQSPFSEPAGWLNTRLLMPAVSHIFFFREKWLYFIFSIVLINIFITMLQAWNEKNAHLSAWQILSVCTSSFVMLQFQFPGYPDILVFLFFILVMLDDICQEAKLSLLFLGLITHESSVFIGVILAWRFLDRKNGAIYLAILFLYTGIWILTAKGDISSILSSHNVNGISGLEWIHKHPWREMFGIFFSYKLLWLLVIVGVITSYLSVKYKDGIFIIAVFGMGVAMTFLGVDTSRLLGFAFPGLLVSLAVLQSSILTRLRSWVVYFICFFNSLCLYWLKYRLHC